MLSRLYTDVYDSPTSVWGVESSVNKLSDLAGRDPTLVSSSIPSQPSPPLTTPSHDVHVRALTRRQLFWQPVDPSTQPPPSVSGSTPDAPTTVLGEGTTSVVNQPSETSDTVIHLSSDASSPAHDFDSQLDSSDSDTVESDTIPSSARKDHP